MKFVVSANTLLKHLQIVGGSISSSTVLPILEDFLFVIKNSKLQIFATDLETSMSTELEVESKTDGSVAIPARILTDTLKNLPDQPLTFNVDESTFAIEITSDFGKYNLSGESGDEYPNIPKAEGVEKASIDSSTLLEAISSTIFATSTDELRPAMTGVFVQMNDAGITFVATDAHRLVRFVHADATFDKPTSFIIPKKSMSLLKNALPVNEQTQVEIAYNDNNVFFSFDNVELISRLIDAKYPDYNAVIPTDNPNKLYVNRTDLQKSLRRISIYANKTTHQVRLKINGNDLQISAEDLDFSNAADERMTCQYDGENMEIGFNARFLAEMLGNLTAEEIMMELSTSTRAGLLIPQDDDKDRVLMLIMPVMLNT